MTEQTEGSGPSELELLKNRARLLGIDFSNNIGLDTLRERIEAKMSEIDDEDRKSIVNTHIAESDENIAEVVDTDHGEESVNFDKDIEEEDSVDNSQMEVNGFTAAAQIAAAKPIPPQVQPIKPIQPKIVDTVNPSISQKTGQAIEAKPGKPLSLRQRIYNEQMKLVRLQITNLDPKKSDLQGELLAVGNKFIGTVKLFVPYGEITDDGWHIPYIIYKELERRKFLSIRTTKDRRTGQIKVTKSWAKEFALTILPPLTEEELKRLATAQAAAGSIDNPSEILG